MEILLAIAAACTIIVQAVMINNRERECDSWRAVAAAMQDRADDYEQRYIESRRLHCDLQTRMALRSKP